MTTKSVIDFFAVAKEDKFLQHRTQLAADIDTIINIAKEYSYEFTGTELQAFLGRMPKKDLASAVNPGIGNRLHMNPK